MGKKRSVLLSRDPALVALDIVSYGRRGPQAPSRFSAEQLAQIGRTAGRVPEVMVKVSGGGREAGAVQAHFSYIGRHGKLEIETDDGRSLIGKGAARELVDDWDLQGSAGAYRVRRAKAEGADLKRLPKEVHNIVLSMPASTPPKKLLAAARAFAAETFGGQHRYAMALHTDQKHPHVHLVVKAVSEQGQRLYIRKATLRAWREEFAKALRAQGVAANATPPQLRGTTGIKHKTTVHRAVLRGNSTLVKERLNAVVRELKNGRLRPEPGKSKVLDTREQVVRQWRQTVDILRAQREVRLAQQVEQFIATMPPPRTDKERIAVSILKKAIRKTVPQRQVGSAAEERSLERAR